MKYEKEIEKIGKDALNDLEPVARKGLDNIINLLKVIVNDAIDCIFKNKHNKN